LTKSITSHENQKSQRRSAPMMIAEDEIADRFQMKSVIVFLKIRTRRITGNDRPKQFWALTGGETLLNPKMVLQGHTDIRESVIYNGCQFITSGAVCGRWWKGPREGHPRGFGVLTVRAKRSTGDTKPTNLFPRPNPNFSPAIGKRPLFVA
jgi:hypothetical protein